MKRFFILFIFLSFSGVAIAGPPTNKERSKFYDFNDQIVNGEIRRPTALYTSAREKAKFERLLELKKSFLPRLFKTHRLKVFK
jgi:hypothetical protein